VIRAVGADSAAALPAGPVAITSTRNVEFTSPLDSLYARDRTEVSSQAPPVGEQRRHRYAIRIGAVPVHVPFAAARVAPATGEPAMVGGTLL
jgi:hypothetical protein